MSRSVSKRPPSRGIFLSFSGQSPWSRFEEVSFPQSLGFQKTFEPSIVLERLMGCDASRHSTRWLMWPGTWIWGPQIGGEVENNWILFRIIHWKTLASAPQEYGASRLTSASKFTFRGCLVLHPLSRVFWSAGPSELLNEAGETHYYENSDLRLQVDSFHHRSARS